MHACLLCLPSCSRFLLSLCLQNKRHKSKKGGIKKRVYFWAGICWHGKTPGVAWTAADNKVLFRHTKNICVGTLFADWDDDRNEEVVWRVTESRSGGRDGYVWYVDHFAYPDETPPRAEWEHSSFDEVKTWHAQTRAVLAQRADLQPPTGMQDTAKTLEIYEEVCVACVLFVDHVTHHTHTHTPQALYPTLTKFGLDQIVEDNASPHNNDKIRARHTQHNVRIVGYTATEAQKEQITALIREQVQGYRREQDKKAQITKQTNEFDRLPSWFVLSAHPPLTHSPPLTTTCTPPQPTRTCSNPTYTRTQAAQFARPQPHRGCLVMDGAVDSRQ